MNRVNGQGEAPKGVSILPMTDAKSLRMVHWEIHIVTYFRDTSLTSRKSKCITTLLVKQSKG